MAPFFTGRVLKTFDLCGEDIATTVEKFYGSVKRKLKLLDDSFDLYQNGKLIEDGNTLHCEPKDDSSFELQVDYDCEAAASKKIKVECEKKAYDIITGGRKNFKVKRINEGEACSISIEKKGYNTFVSFLNHRALLFL